MDKEVVVLMYNGISLSHERNEIGSFVETWMDLETVIQSEVSQKEKNKYRILTNICGIQKNGTDEPVCRAEIETQMQRTNVWTPRGESGGGGGGGGVMNWGIGTDVYTLICIKSITNKNLLYKKKLKKKTTLALILLKKQQMNCPYSSFRVLKAALEGSFLLKD